MGSDNGEAGCYNKPSSTAATTAWRRFTFQRYFWNPIYDRLARGYDAVDWLTGFTTQRLRTRALAYLPHPGTRLLEIGFGSGMLHAGLASRYKMAGIDLAPGMAGLTRQRLDNSGRHSALCVGSVYAIPWPDATFDAVLSTFAFSAFADADRALDEMVRVIVPGGKVIIVDAGRADDGNLVAAMLARVWEPLGDYMRDERPLLAVAASASNVKSMAPKGAFT